MYEAQCRATLEDLKGFEVIYWDAPGSTTKAKGKAEFKAEVNGAIGSVDEVEKGLERGEVELQV